jgi:hypothetical protein
MDNSNYVLVLKRYNLLCLEFKGNKNIDNLKHLCILEIKKDKNQ